MTYSETEAAWVPLRGTVDRANNTVTGSTRHFSDFDLALTNWEAARLPTLDRFQVAPFTGAATFSYPIWVPPGPGGIQPELTLTYNSQSVDDASGKTQAAWVGMGWSLDTGYIRRNMHGTSDFFGDDTFSLVLNGLSETLIRVENPPEAPANVQAFHTSRENFWRVWATTSSEGVITGWTLWDPVGNRFTFGDQTHPESTLDERAKYPICAAAADEPPYRYWYWPLVALETPSAPGQPLRYFYSKETRSPMKCEEDGPNRTLDLAVYPESILYPHGRYRVHFVRQADRRDFDGGSWNKIYSRVFFMRSRLDRVQIQKSVGNGWENLREVDLVYAGDPGAPTQTTIYPNYSWPAGGKTLTLVQILEYGLSGAGPLPPTTFFMTACG